MIEIVNGSIVDATEKYIAHITNCVSTKSAGTAKAIFDKYPYSNTYITRTKPTEVNTIEILGDGIEKRFIINIYSMMFPGAPFYPESIKDGVKTREKQFYKCLNKISKITNLKSIAFPYGVGCNLAGGDWDYYFGVLSNFEKYVNSKFDVKVALYKL